MFVCTGNICRSPIAERLLTAHDIPEIQASSAGIRAVIGDPIHKHAASVLAGLGGNADGFCARQISAKIALSADLILTMTKAHRDAVLGIAPKKLRSTFTLAEASRLATHDKAATVGDLAELRSQYPTGSWEDIADPIGHSRDVFEEVGTRIANLLPPVIDVCMRSATPLT